MTRIKWAQLTSPRGETRDGFWVLDGDVPVHEKACFDTKEEADECMRRNSALVTAAAWLRENGYVRPDLWDATERYDIAAHFGGEVVHTGGGCMVILVPQENGDVIGITEEVVCYYKRQDGDGDAYDVFWNRSEEAESVSLCE